MAAEQAELLDELSGGRFHLGVGRGARGSTFEVFGAVLDRHHHGLRRFLDLLLAALTSPRIAATGPQFRFLEADVVPRPRTHPHP